jgi:hypothetical protein
MGIDDKIDINLHADSSAAIGICKRTGIGKVRHLATGQLWIQEKIRHGDIALFKVLGTDNPADLFTKHVPRESADKYISTMSVTRETGRAEVAPRLQA